MGQGGKFDLFLAERITLHLEIQQKEKKTPNNSFEMQNKHMNLFTHAKTREMERLTRNLATSL